MEQVKQFKYLGSWITEAGRSIVEVKARIGMAKSAYTDRRELLTNRLSLPLKKKIVKTVIWPVLMYGCETWTMTKEVMRRIEACEMWLWRKMGKVKWSDRKTNEEVLQMVSEERSLLCKILSRKKNWIGYVLRGEGLLRDVMEGRMEGKRGRGRKRKSMLEELMKRDYAQMKRHAQNREEWRRWMPRTCREAENK